MYGYTFNDPINFFDPLGLFDITVNEKGTRDGNPFGAEIIVKGENGTGVVVQGSTFPNPRNTSPGISSGSFNPVFRITGHRGEAQGVRLRDGAFIPTRGPNPAQGGRSVANGINIHCGFSFTNRGSAGCLTIKPDQCNAFFGVLKDGERGTVTVNTR